MFADLALARRLERTEGYSCAQYAETRRRLYPECGSKWQIISGAFAVFDGAESPITQSFGLGLFDELTDERLAEIERFFQDAGASVQHEVCPLVGVATLDLLCRRQYRPIEISSVVYCAVEKPSEQPNPNINIRVAGPQDSRLWAETSAEGWAHEHPELADFVREAGAVLTAREDTVAFLADIEGEPAATGVLCIHEGVALFAGAATVPAMRRRGLQAALLRERMRYAAEHGCDLAMMVAEAGSDSQRNAERRGFQVAYTRTKWQLLPEDKALDAVK